MKTKIFFIALILITLTNLVIVQICAEWYNKGVENYKTALNVSKEINASTDFEIECVEYTYGFDDLKWFEKPNWIQLIRSGATSVPRVTNDCNLMER